MRKLKMRIGDLLVMENVISDHQLKQALESQKERGTKLGKTLIEQGFIEEEDLLQFLSRQLEIPLINLQKRTLSEDVVKYLPEKMARRLRAIVVEESRDGVFTVAMSDPGDLAAVDAIREQIPKPVSFAIAPERQILDAFNQYYRRTEEIASFASELATEAQGDEFDLADLGRGDDDSETAVAKLLQSLFDEAVQISASDIHIEPDADGLRIRMRVDGVLQETVLQQRKIAPALVLRLKLMAGLDISEKRLPQDGRTQIKVGGTAIDVRMSTMPIQYGESVVMRLLDQSKGMLNLDDTGMPSHILSRFRQVVHQPQGMVLVTGPTGSGKTTTLYAALSELNQPGVKIITVEDPVEYRLPRINQVQTNSKIDLTFSRVLRTTLRQDPDIIMVGEMRDHETVEIGLRGSLTGHLVLSTLHTNDAISSAVRLLDMGAPGYLVAGSLKAIVAQRLIRRVCGNCRQETSITQEQKVWLQALGVSEDELAEHFYTGQGCGTCRKMGYKGRVGVFELLTMTEALMEPLKRDDTEEFSRLAAKSPGYAPLWRAAFDLAKEGLTSIDEALRLAGTESAAKDNNAMRDNN